MPIFDQGYQHWNGPLSGHAWRWLAITRHGVRIGMKGRALRSFLLLSLMPAVALVFALSLWGLVERKSELVAVIVQFLVSANLLNPAVVADPRHYRVEIWTLCYTLFLSTELTLSMILVLLVGPELISQDLRFNALPLYLSRPLRRIDYLVGKLGVIAAFLGMVIIVPCLLAYVLGLLFSLDLTILSDTYRLLLASVGYGLVIILSAGTLILALSSLSRNSRYVALFWLGIWIVSGIVATVLQSTYQVQRRQEAYRHAVAAQQATSMPEPAPQEPSGRRRQGRRAPPMQRWGGNEFENDELEASKTNWRPLISYTGNLSRIGRQLLGTDAAWKTLSELEPAYGRQGFLFRSMGPQYPWYWSATVLAGLFGLSACILSLSVRSLDRLR
ncbi:MAG TPA: ABC transporter permease subunit [Planctomycetaceae bacterium]|jgi:ABC-2 type transport system permease protein|nr:ABC transporter permease subunit [Planctomycetaceae bacterium]